jgi:hypothetical protein
VIRSHSIKDTVSIVPTVPGTKCTDILCQEHNFIPDVVYFLTLIDMVNFLFSVDNFFSPE